MGNMYRKNPTQPLREGITRGALRYLYHILFRRGYAYEQNRDAFINP